MKKRRSTVKQFDPYRFVGVRLHLLSLKIAGVTSSVVLGTGLLWSLVEGGPSLVVAVGMTAVSLVAAYVGARYFLESRLELARKTLKQIRKYRFGKLDRTHLPRGDELNALIRQVYRTGQVLEWEFNELKRIENYRRDFLGNVSHELKTPIFAISGFAETLLDGAIEDPVVNRSFVEKISRNALRLINLAMDLGEIVRLETGELQMNIEAFEVLPLISEIIDSVESIATGRRVSVRTSVEDDLPAVMGDSERIRRVLVNLVENAIRYTGEDGNVLVGARRTPGDTLNIFVTDDGIGISPTNLPRITERFFRVDASRSRSAGGTGLGLAIVKHILAAHKQSLEVESQPGTGSTFGFELPTAGASSGPARDSA